MTDRRDLLHRLHTTAARLPERFYELRFACEQASQALGLYGRLLRHAAEQQLDQLRRLREREREMRHQREADYQRWKQERLGGWNRP